MLFEKMDLAGKKNEIAVGYDIGREYAQISYCKPLEEPQTLPVVAGTEQYNIPLVLCKRHGVNQWFYGKEALRNAKEGEGTLVELLLDKAEAGVPVTVDGEEFDPAALLALFIKRSLSLLALEAGTGRIGAFIITADNLSKQLLEVFEYTRGILQLSSEQFFYQHHGESFYHYTIHQPRELWHHHTIVCDFSGAMMKTYCMQCNKKTVPIVAFIEERQYSTMQKALPTFGTWDMEFLKIVEEMTAEKIVSTVYLIGDGFQEEWCKESLKAVCKNRRVFKGNNLFGKGACYAASAKLRPDMVDKEFVFLGNDKLKANIGMKVVKKGEESYFALLDAGVSWYESKKECAFILERGNSLSLMITPLTGGEAKEVNVILEGLPEREDKTTRISFAIGMQSEQTFYVNIEDLGFGEITPSSGKVWKEEYEI